jgi:exonuclease III
MHNIMVSTKLLALFLTVCLSFSPLILGDTECPNIYSIGDRRKDKNSLRLVQYNVEWLFIDYYAGMDCPGNGCTWHSVSDAQTHMTYVANTIKTLQPDIINFCEVEGCDELNMLKEQLDSTYNPYLKKGTDTGTGQNVGMLTRIDPLVSLYRSEEKVSYPISGTKCGSTTASGTTGVSKHYITEFKMGSMNVAMIGAHLLAIPTDPSRCVQREGQAQVLQNIVSSYIQKSYEVILIGDMNDYDAEVLDLNSDKPTSRVLDIMKGLDGEKKGTYTLTNVATKIAQSERYSDWWDSDNNCNTSSQKDLSMIDHVLVTSGINKKITNVYIYHGYKEYCGKWDSDHWPVVIDINTA